MEELFNNIQFSNIWWAIGTPMILMVIDVITGYYNAWKNNEISSSKMRDGLGKKCAELCYIVVGVLLKFAIGVDIAMYGLVLYVCYMEIISLAENCDKLGIKLPKWLKDKLNNVSNEINGNENKEDK